MKSYPWIIGLLVCVVIAGCGGGGSASSGNTAPVIASLIAPVNTVSADSTLTITCTATDANADALQYFWSTTGGACEGTGSTVIWHAPSSTGTYRVTCTVTDGKGGVASKTITLLVTGGNLAPEILLIGAVSTAIPTNGSTDVSCSATDPEGDALTYTWSLVGGASFGGKADVTWYAPAQTGFYLLSCEVRDQRGGVAMGTVVITVRDPFPPDVIATSVTPSSLRFTGGTVTIGAEVASEAAVQFVEAHISRAGEAPIVVTLSPQSVGYQGEWTAPANLRQDGVAETYTVTVVVTDKLWQVTESAPRTLTVQAIDPPPPGPGLASAR